jgi:hypothetical protein
MPTTNRRTPLSSMETANNKPTPEKYQPQLFGMDAELKEKMEAKYDLEMERKAIEWMLEVTEEEVFPGGDDFFLGLRDGVLLCKLLNSINPGIVKKFHPSPNHVLVERENIQVGEHSLLSLSSLLFSRFSPLTFPKAFLSGCLALGVPSHELFSISDLHEGKDLAAVLRTVYAIGRQAQVTPNFEGPRLGVKYSVTLEEQATRKEKKMKEQYALWLREKDIGRLNHYLTHTHTLSLSLSP